MTGKHYTLCLFIFAILNSSILSKTLEEDREYIQKLQAECENNKKFIVKRQYSVECLTTHQHYNSLSTKRYSESTALRRENVRIGGFNLWHPGSQNSIHKDYKLVAKIINDFDVISALELLPLVNIDLKNNNSVLDYLDETPRRIKNLKNDYRAAVRAGNDDDAEDIKAEITRLERDLKKAPKLYRSPGYLKLLTELRKLDDTWSLILSPRGDSAKVIHVKELTGFFYRGRTVKPITNDHCQETYKKSKGKKIACFPNLRKSFMNRETSFVFSRRPLLASFKSGNFDFSLLTSHVVFTSPHPVEKREEMERILGPSFGVKEYHGIGVGVDSQNYARFAESKVILELMDKLKSKYKEKDILYIGDMNLKVRNAYWSTLLKDHSEPHLLVEDATSLSTSQYNSQGERTNAMASNYDHFISPNGSFSNCLKRNGEYDVKRIPYLSGDVKQYIQENYIVRSKRLKNTIFEEEASESVEEPFVNDYGLTRDGRKLLATQLSNYSKKLSKVYTVKRDEIVKDDSKNELKLKYFEERVFLSQLKRSTFYRVYKELISDHYPILMKCSNK